MSTGTITHGFHEGTRSEYLAHYVFSAFGSAAPIPHPEDHGLDLHCSIGERVGALVHVKGSYFVQVKSTKDPIAYKGKESARWLLDLRSPLLICHVAKRENLVEIFQTLPLAMYAPSNNIEEVTLHFQDASWPPTWQPVTALMVALGNPILRFNISELADRDWTNTARGVLRSYIEWDQTNIDAVKAVGFPICKFPTEIATGALLGQDRVSYQGNFKAISDATSGRYQEALVSLLAQTILQTTASNNPDRLHALLQAITTVINIAGVRGTAATQLLEWVANHGLRHLGLKGKFAIAPQ